MHVVEVFGRIFISSLFIIEAVRKFFSPDEGMMYMSQYGVPEVLFYPSLVFEFIVPLVLIAGFIFGKWSGTLLATVSLTLGATILYLFANYFIKDLIEEKFSKKFSNLNDKFKKNEFIFFLIYRFIGGIPFQIQNILPVLFNVKLKNYFFGTLLGMTPQIFVWATLGNGIEKIIYKNIQVPSFKDLILSPEIYLPIIGFIVILILGLLTKKKFFKD